MIGWYNGESWRVFPNIELTYNKNETLIYVTIAWCKFIFEFEIKW